MLTNLTVSFVRNDGFTVVRAKFDGAEVIGTGHSIHAAARMAFARGAWQIPFEDDSL